MMAPARQIPISPRCARVAGLRHVLRVPEGRHRRCRLRPSVRSRTVAAPPCQPAMAGAEAVSVALVGAGPMAGCQPRWSISADAVQPQCQPPPPTPSPPATVAAPYARRYRRRLQELGLLSGSLAEAGADARPSASRLAAKMAPCAPCSWAKRSMCKCAALKYAHALRSNTHVRMYMSHAYAYAYAHGRSVSTRPSGPRVAVPAFASPERPRVPVYLPVLHTRACP